MGGHSLGSKLHDELKQLHEKLVCTGARITPHDTWYHMMTLCTRCPMMSSGPSARLLVRPPATAAVASPGRPTSAPSAAALVLKLPRSDEDGVPALLPGPPPAAPAPTGGPTGDAAAAAPLSSAEAPPAGPPPAAARPELAGWCTTLLSRCNCGAECAPVPPACAGGPSTGGGALVMEGSGMRPKSGMPSPCPGPGRGRATDRLPGLETTPGASERPPPPPAAPSE